MALQLSGQSERLPEPHREFYGQVRIQMPLLISGKDEKGRVVDIPRNPASFDYTIGRRMEAPEDVIETWQKNYVFTGDGSTAGTNGDQLIILDAQALRMITAESELYKGALVLPDGAWDELKSQKDTVLHLTAEEVEEAQDKGYINFVLPCGRILYNDWVPANKTVGKVWDYLSRGRNLANYIILVSRSCPQGNSLLNLYFNRTLKDGKPTMRPWVADRIGRNSSANGSDDLGSDVGRLVGVAPEAHLAREKALEARVQTALNSKESFVFNGTLYVPVASQAAAKIIQ